MAVAVVELNVAICQFHNIDLFEKGFYSVKCYLDPIRQASTCDVQLLLPKNASVCDEDATLTSPGELLGGRTAGFCTTPVKVHYSDDQFDVRTGISLKICFPIGSTSTNFSAGLESATADLNLELFFNSKDESSMKRVCKKQLRLHHIAWPGIRFGGRIVFDFFYTCAVDLTVSSALLGFDVAPNKVVKRSSLATVIGNPRSNRSVSVGRRTQPSAAVGRTQSLSDPPVSSHGLPPRRGSSGGFRSGRRNSEQIYLQEEQEHSGIDVDTMTKRLRIMGRMICDSLGDTTDSLVALSIEGLSKDMEHTHDVAEKALAAALERLGEAAYAHDLVNGEFWRFLNESHRLLSEAWSTLRDVYSFDPIVYKVLYKDCRLHRVEQLEHGYYILQHPGDGVMVGLENRGMKLTTLATSLRASKFFDLLKPSWVEDITDSIKPKCGPIVAEYRTFPQPTVDFSSARCRHTKQKCHQHPSAEMYTQALAEFRTQIGSYAKFLSESTPCHNEQLEKPNSGKGHLIFCVHGLNGNQYDLRSLKLHVLATLPDVEFVMSSCNQENTHASFETMTEGFIAELDRALDSYKPRRVSFIGHSLGTIIIRCALSKPHVQARFDLPKDISTSSTVTLSTATPIDPMGSPRMARRNTVKQKPTLQTFVSLAGPHLGALYLGGMITTGMWFLSRWKRSSSLACLTLSDTSDPKDSFLYKLSKNNSLLLFKNVILQASPQDKYVNLSSALIHPCVESSSDSRLGPLYNEMAHNLMDPLVNSKRVNISRMYLMVPPGPRTVASIIGRAAHIACLDDDHVAQKVAVGIVRYLM